MTPTPTPCPPEKGFWSEIRRRLHGPTPAFWKKVRNRCLLTVPILSGIAALPLVHPLDSIVSYTIAGLTGMAAAAQLTCDDAPPATNAPGAPTV